MTVSTEPAVPGPSEPAAPAALAAGGELPAPGTGSSPIPQAAPAAALRVPGPAGTGRGGLPLLEIDAGRIRQAGSAAPGGVVARLRDRFGAGIRRVPRRRDLVRMRLRDQVRTTIAEPPARLAVAGAKGGVGKTTIALALGATLGRLRHSRVIAYEANHMGSFGSRLALARERSILDLLELIRQSPEVVDIPLPTVDRYATHLPDDRFSVLAAPRDPALAAVLGDEDHRRLLELLYRYFDIVIADLDPALLHSGTAHWLGQVADQVLVVSATGLSGARLAEATLGYLEARRGTGWVRQRVQVVINGVRAASREADAIERHLRERVHGVHRVPWDAHLERGGPFSWAEIQPPTRAAYLAIGAGVGAAFALPRSPAAEGAASELLAGPRPG